MKAKCPHCNTGCDRCAGGYVEARIAKGDVYTRHCDACGQDNGGRVDGPGLPPMPPTPSRCVWCKSERTRWVKVSL